MMWQHIAYFVASSDVEHPGHRWTEDGIWELIIVIIGCVRGWLASSSDLCQLPWLLLLSKMQCSSILHPHAPVVQYS